MKIKSKKILYAFVAFVMLFSGMPIQRVFAAGNALLFTPTPSTLNINATITIDVKSYIESPAQNGSAAGRVLYPKSLLQVVATSTSGSAYGAPAVNHDPNYGTIDFNGQITPGPGIGIKKVFTVTFKAIAAGSATLSFSGDSKINNGATTLNTGQYTIIDPNPAPVTPQPAPVTPAPVTPTPVPTPIPAPVETPPTPTTVEENTTDDATGVIEDVSSNYNYNSASVKWKHSKPQTTTKLMFGATKTGKVTKGELSEIEGGFSARMANLKPGTRYYFTITSEDEKGKISTYDSVIVTRGYPVTVIITRNEAPLAETKIQIGSLSRTTDKDGAATFELAAGNYSLSMTGEDGATSTVSMTVASKLVPAEGKAPDSQRYSFNLDPARADSSGGPSILSFIVTLIIGGAVIVLGGLGFIAYRRRQIDNVSGDTMIATGPSVVINDGYNWQQQSPQAPLAPPPLPEAPRQYQAPNVVQEDEYEEPKDMFELAKEREAALKSQNDSTNTPPPTSPV